MNVRYTARQAALTPEIKTYCEKRLARLKSLVADVLDVNVILNVQKGRANSAVGATPWRAKLERSGDGGCFTSNRLDRWALVRSAICTWPACTIGAIIAVSLST